MVCFVEMPKAESKSKKERPKRKYSHEQILSATSAFKDNPTNKSIRQIAKDNGVPESTL